MSHRKKGPPVLDPAPPGSRTAAHATCVISAAAAAAKAAAASARRRPGRRRGCLEPAQSSKAPPCRSASVVWPEPPVHTSVADSATQASAKASSCPASVRRPRARGGGGAMAAEDGAASIAAKHAACAKAPATVSAAQHAAAGAGGAVGDGGGGGDGCMLSEKMRSMGEAQGANGAKDEGRRSPFAATARRRRSADQRDGAAPSLDHAHTPLFNTQSVRAPIGGRDSINKPPPSRPSDHTNLPSLSGGRRGTGLSHLQTKEDAPRAHPPAPGGARGAGRRRVDRAGGRQGTL